MKKLYTLILFISLGFASFAQYTFTNIATNLPYPVSFDTDSDGNYYITLKGGAGWGVDSAARVDVYSPAGNKLGEVWDFTDSIETYFERGVLGVELDPDFSNNNYIYVFYNHDSPAKIRVVRFTMSGFTGTNPTIILDIDDPNGAGNHTGGNIHFRPSEPDKLYVTIGDRAVSAYAQQTTNPWGKILRINSDGTIPTDNPFYDDGDPNIGNDDRIWAYGIRNTFDFTFSVANDSLYGSENGQNTLDETNQVIKGGNYGWSDCEGTQDYNGSCSTPGYLAPIQVFGPVGGGLPSVTGILYYSGTVMPEFDNHLLLTTYTDATIRDIELGNAPAYDTEVSTQTLFNGQFSGLVDIIQGADGCLYVLDGGYTTNGKIIRICPDDLNIGEEDQIRVRLFPNPVQENLAIYTDEPLQSIELLDLNGRLIRSLKLLDNTVDVSDLTQGVYLIRAISKEGQVSTKRFVKQ